MSGLLNHTPTAGKVKETFLRGPLPVWQHRLRDVFTLEKLIKNEIGLSCPGINADNAPTEPIMFSYWIISTMPFKFKQRLDIVNYTYSKKICVELNIINR